MRVGRRVAVMPSFYRMQISLRLRRRRRMEVLPDGLRRFLRHHGCQRLGRCGAHILEAAKVRQEPLAGIGAHAGNRQQFRISIAHLAALAVVADRKPVALVANPLHEVQHG